jgi:hypothetical protein
VNKRVTDNGFKNHKPSRLKRRGSHRRSEPMASSRLLMFTLCGRWGCGQQRGKLRQTALYLGRHECFDQHGEVCADILRERRYDVTLRLSR